jgi:uroporphyrinogen decarboxylase
VSPAQFEELVLPCDARVVASIRDAGGYCIKHTDGNIQKIIEPLVGTGLHALGPLEDVPGMELDGILRRFAGRLTVMGNISVDLLSRGTVEEVVTVTKGLLERVSTLGEHIMSSGNTIAGSVNPGNFVAMVETTRRYGVYPIDTGALQAESGPQA